VQVREMALALGVVGLMNTQFAIQGERIYVLEVNPRASRTVPFVAKATGVALAKIAARCMVGKSLAAQGALREVIPHYTSVKGPVFPFVKFPGVDPLLGPEMRSTGEVMGVGTTFGEAFAKARRGANERLPKLGMAFLSVRDADKPRLVVLAQELVQAGFELVATRGTQQTLLSAGLKCARINKVAEGRPHIVDMMKNGEIAFIVNTTEGRQAIADSFSIRREALQHRIVYSTTIPGARAILLAMAHEEDRSVHALKTLHATLAVAN
jgi:carbamoyl-phosphate synthase large subunit